MIRMILSYVSYMPSVRGSTTRLYPIIREQNINHTHGIIQYRLKELYSVEKQGG